jgi:hypothetical protein
MLEKAGWAQRVALSALVYENAWGRLPGKGSDEGRR